MKNLPYRRCVGIMLLNKDNLVFVGKRKGGIENAGEEHNWQMPQGGIDEDEEPFKAAKRELYEETNIKSVSLITEVPGWLDYGLPQDLIGLSWKGKYRGQTQKWFVFRFTGKKSEIDVATPGNGAHKAEFVDFDWVEASTLPDLIVSFKRDIYKKLLRFYKTLI